MPISMINTRISTAKIQVCCDLSIRMGCKAISLQPHMEAACSDNLIHIKMSSVHWLVASSVTNSVQPSASQQYCQHYSAGNSAQERKMSDCCRLRLKRDGTRAETRSCLSAKRTSPFKSAGASVQSTTGSQVVHISGSNAGYTMF